MKTIDIKLGVEYTKLGLPAPAKEPRFTGYILQNYEYCKDRKRPAVIICPGGGYALTSEREATPVALEYLSAGFSVFVLHYSVAPNRFPVSLVELATAVATVRKNAEEWNIDTDKIVVNGFSAGGHLVASLGVFWDSEILAEKGFCDKQHKPDALILSYPVILSSGKAHKGSFVNLLGDDTEKIPLLSLEKQVTNKLPPVFLWHTFEDAGVPPQNSMAFAAAAMDAGVLTELHIYPKGTHGLSLGNELVNPPELAIPATTGWISLATRFIKDL